MSIDVAAGTVTLSEDTYNSWKYTKTTKLITLPLDEWFSLRIEYYPPSETNDVRIKVFVNGKLLTISDNYFGKHYSPPGEPAADVSYTQLFALSSADMTVYLDNLHTYTYDEAYVPSTDTTLIYNADLTSPPPSSGDDGTADAE